MIITAQDKTTGLWYWQRYTSFGGKLIAYSNAVFQTKAKAKKAAGVCYGNSLGGRVSAQI